MKFKKQEILKSKKEALDKIKELLSVDDVNSQFDTISGEYHSRDKFIVNWVDNYKGMPSEFSIDKTDSFYQSYSGYRAILATRSLFHEKQLSGYTSIERALCEVALKKLCTKQEAPEFYNTFVVKYNEKLKKLKNESN